MKRKITPKTAHYVEMPYWILTASDDECLELIKKDKPTKWDKHECKR